MVCSLSESELYYLSPSLRHTSGWARLLSRLGSRAERELKIKQNKGKQTRGKLKQRLFSQDQHFHYLPFILQNSPSFRLKNPSCFSRTKRTPSFSNLLLGWLANRATSALLNFILARPTTAYSTRKGRIKIN